MILFLLENSKNKFFLDKRGLLQINSNNFYL